MTNPKIHVSNMMIDDVYQSFLTVSMTTASEAKASPWVSIRYDATPEEVAKQLRWLADKVEIFAKRG